MTTVNTPLTSRPVTFPAPIKRGDTIAITAPAGKIKQEVVEKAVNVLEKEGYKVKVMPHTYGVHGSFSGTPDERFSDFKQAWEDPEVKAIICARGGYGVVHILGQLETLDYRTAPKWVAGFSDISALHAFLANKGIASIHSSMTSHIGKFGMQDTDNKSLMEILAGGRPAYIFPQSQYDHKGIATGRLYGGNLAVLAELVDTPYNILVPDSILFIEDIAEPIYKIERLLYQMKLSGLLDNVKGMLVGQFTEYHKDELHDKMEEMIARTLAPYKMPIAFDVPIGHVDHNIPVIESAMVTLKVSPSGKNSLIFHR